MLASRITSSCGQIPITAFVSGLRRPVMSSRPANPTGFYNRIQLLATETRSATSRHARRKTLKESMMAPAGDSAFNAGKGFVAGGAALGIGALCFYGMGLSKEQGAIDRSVAWSPEVRQRINDTYMYFGGGLGVTAAAAVAACRSPMVMNLMMKNSLMSFFATMALLVGSGVVTRSIPYQPGVGSKQLAWMTHAGIMGAILAPLSALGGPLVLRAAYLTAGVVGGLSAVAVCAPSDKFLNMGGLLGAGLGVVFLANIGSMFMPPSTVIGSGLYSIAIYGGLVLFSLFLLYDTQKIIQQAENPTRPYDPVNQSMGIYMDTMNIFIRIAMILSNNRKK